MKRIFLIATTAFLLSACGTMNNDPPTRTSSGHADVFEKTFRDFTACDARFFQTLNREAVAWKSVASLESLGNYSRIKVKENDDHVDFTEPPTVAGLELLSFFDEMSDLGNLGLYYYWGFTISGKLEDVARKLNPLINDKARLRRDGAVYVRSEVKIPGIGSGWVPFATTSNTPAGAFKIERVFLIEPHESRKDVIRVSCSLQGGVNADVLREERPDIAPKDYPVQLAATLFDDMKIPDNVAGIARNTPWKPRFKKLSYTYIPKSSDSATGKKPVTVTMEALDDLVLVREIYSPSFNVQRLKLAGPGLIQLKARMNGIGDGRVLLTTDIKTSFPSMLKKGEKLSMVITAKNQPSRAGDKETQSSLLCDVVGEFDAKEIFPSLTGRAHRLSCAFDKGNDIHTRAYLEDLGISIDLDGRSRYGNFTYSFTQFSVEHDSAK